MLKRLGFHCNSTSSYWKYGSMKILIKFGILITFSTLNQPYSLPSLDQSGSLWKEQAMGAFGVWKLIYKKLGYLYWSQELKYQIWLLKYLVQITDKECINKICITKMKHGCNLIPRISAASLLVMTCWKPPG